MNYYNEIDPTAVAWLQELISVGAIAQGIIDDRSIVDVTASDLKGFTQCHFFAGIGGWPLALRLAGWPDNEEADTGSCPCQPFSQAGRKKKYKDPRHLWPHFYRLIQKRKPAVVFGEQVASAAGRLWMSRVRSQLETLAYEVGAADLCAAGVGSPHVRQRLFWVADSRRKSTGRRNSQHQKSSRAVEIRPSNKFGRSGGSIRMVYSDRSGLKKQCRKISMEAQQLAAQCPGSLGAWSRFEIIECADEKFRRFEPESFPMADGFPGRVGILRGYGNAIVPLLGAEFVAAYMEAQ